MTSSLWGPDGQWLGSAPPAPAPDPEPPRVASALRTGCLLLVGVALLVPAAVLFLVSLISGASEPTDTATATVTSVGPGVDELGRQRPHCYTVSYVVEAGPRTHRSCDVLIDPKRLDGRFEDEQEQEQRFAAEHPVGSRVEVLYEVESGTAEGEVAAVGYTRTGGNPRLTLFAGLGSALCVAGTFFAFRGTRRATRPRAAGPSAAGSTAPPR